MAEQSKAMTQARTFFETIGWRCVSDDAEILMGLVDGDNSQWHWGLQERGEGRFLAFHAFCPVNVPSGRRAAAAEYLTRANWGLHFGSFDFDWSDGRVVLRTSIPISRSGVSTKAMEHLVFASCALMERYLPGLLSVALGGVNPKKAQEDAERPAETPTETAGAAHPADPSAVTTSDDGVHAVRFGRLFLSDN